jgi:hypothetical protein
MSYKEFIMAQSYCNEVESKIFSADTVETDFIALSKLFVT